MQAAICGAASDRATDASQGNAAVHCLEVDFTADIIDRDAAIVRRKRQIGSLWHKDLEAHVPLMVIARLGSFSKDVEAAGLDSHLLRQSIRLGLSRRARLNLCAHQNVAALPTLD